MSDLLRIARRLAAGFAVACLATRPLHAQERFTLGSPSIDVAQSQGRPRMVERLRSQGYEIWYYGESWVRVSTDGDRVVGWSNLENNLKVEMRPGADVTRDATFSVGSSSDDVVRLQGTPRSLIPYVESGVEVWRYSGAIVRVSLSDRRVVSWDDPGRVLRVGDGYRGAPASPTSPPTNAVPPSGSSASYPRPSAPPSLDATIQLRTPAGNGALVGGDRGDLEVTVRNRGRGTAYGLSLVLGTPNARGVEFGASSPVDSLPPNGRAVLRARLDAPESLRDGSLQIDVHVKEANGFDLDPAPRLTVTTRAFRAPRFVLDGVVVADQSGDGRLAPREIADLRVRVRNAGGGDARDVRATIRVGDNAFLTPDSKAEFSLGAMGSSETRDLAVGVFANSRAKEIPIAIAMLDARQRFDTTLRISLPLDRPLASAQLTVETRQTKPVDGPPPLVVDVDTGVPRAKNPPRDVVAVVLGVERYERLPGVPFAARDAAVFREYAVKTFGVRDDPEHLYYALDADVSGTSLRKVFGTDGWLARRVTAETDVIVYWAGHGGPDLKTRAPFLLPADGDANYPNETGYALRDLYARLAGLPARSITVFLDACFSGWTRDAGQLLQGARDVSVSIENPVLTNERMAVFAASAGNQVSSAWPSMRHGLFTYFLLKGLRGSAVGEDGAVTVGSLDAYLRREVPPQAGRLDREQKPQLTALRTDRRLVSP